MKGLFIVILTMISVSIPASAQISYKVNSDQTTFKWTGYYVFSFGEHYGTIRVSKGNIVTTGDQITGGAFEIDMKTLVDHDMKEDDGGIDLTNHLKSSDFFDTDEYPTARFEITKVEKIKDAKDKQPNYDISGILTLKGVSNPLTFPAYVSAEGNDISAIAKFKFDRTKWNVRYNSGKFFSDVGDGAISDAIGVELTIKATK
jgi:polyisoprenoid-binding protein YceI